MSKIKLTVGSLFVIISSFGFLSAENYYNYDPDNYNVNKLLNYSLYSNTCWNKFLNNGNNMNSLNNEITINIDDEGNFENCKIIGIHEGESPLEGEEETTLNTYTKQDISIDSYEIKKIQQKVKEILDGNKSTVESWINKVDNSKIKTILENKIYRIIKKEYNNIQEKYIKLKNIRKLKELEPSPSGITYINNDDISLYEKIDEKVNNGNNLKELKIDIAKSFRNVRSQIEKVKKIVNRYK